MTNTADLKVTLPLELVNDFLSKLHYVSETLAHFEISPEKRDKVHFELKPGHESEAPAVAARIAELAQKMCRNYRASEAKVLVNHLDVKVPFADDPHPLLKSRGELFTYGTGRFGLGPLLVKLVQLFDSQILQLGRNFSPEPHQYPTLIGADVLDRCKYFRSFPHSLTMVSHLREDSEVIQEFARTARWDGNRLVCKPEQFSNIECLASPAVCFHCYAWLQNARLAAPRTFTAVGKCFRYESGNLGGLERLWDFTMRELIFVGPRDFVLSQREKAIKLAVPMLEEWGLAYEIKSATDPFFMEDFSTQATFQMVFDLKFEIRAALPYKQNTLAAGSFNYHQDFFGRAFDIRDDNQQPVHTGCVAFGLERMALAFLAQYGLDQKLWPPAVANGVKS